ncbi:MAG: YifB family Mg chelatase-like AAA ATPase [Steroidobacteraceae bacterium]
MSVSRVACRAQDGLAAPAVDVEVHLGAGLPTFTIVGLPATEVKESKERVRAALVNSGYEFPAGRITVNLAPADLPKDGGRFDLAIAVGILLASAQVPSRPEVAAALELLGELGLAGELRPVRGALPAAAAAHAAGRALLLPQANARDLHFLPVVRAFAAKDLRAVCAHWSGTQPLAALEPVVLACADTAASQTLDDVCGQAEGKRAIEVAAAGGHGVLFVGPPGCGKSMLAQRLPALLPPLRAEEALEVAMIASIVTPGGITPSPLQRPFRTPHHSASAGAIIGGGPRSLPGEITRAHRGVLFLDELPEFERRVLEALREPLESGTVALARVGARAEYPAAFQLVAAMNPCPCGHAGDAKRRCRCTRAQLARYRARLSGPLLDRIDLRVALAAVTDAELAAHRERSAAADSARATPDAQRRATIAAARARQWQRQGCLNAALDAAALERHARLAPAAQQLLLRIRSMRGLSLRAMHRCLRVARTLADLDAQNEIGDVNVAESLRLRSALEEPADV